MSEIKWIKLSVDMFDNKKIRYLRRLPDGNNIVLIWVMLLTLAGHSNAGGYIMLTEDIPYSVSMLSDFLDMKENTVRLALAQLESLKMIYVEDECFVIKNWSRYQTLDRNSDMREYNRLAKQRSRQRKALDSPPSETSEDSILLDECQISVGDVLEKCQKDVNDNVNDMSMTNQPCQTTEERKKKEEEESMREEEKNEDVHPFIHSREECKRSYLGGKLGRGVVLLSDEQLDDLLDKLSLDEFNKYVEVVANNELRGHHYKKRTHYTAIIEMANKDRRLQP